MAPALAKSCSRSFISSSRRLKRWAETPPGSSTLLGIWFGFCTVNGANCIPRKPAPMPLRRPTLTNAGRSKSGGASSFATTEPNDGNLTPPAGM